MIRVLGLLLGLLLMAMPLLHGSYIDAARIDPRLFAAPFFGILSLPTVSVVNGSLLAGHRDLRNRSESKFETPFVLPRRRNLPARAALSFVLA
jgi:hypothetical protein